MGRDRWRKGYVNGQTYMQTDIQKARSNDNGDVIYIMPY